MILGEFLSNDNLLNLEEEAKQNKDKFKTLMKEAEICLFGKTLDPIIYTNECDFTKNNDISDPELNKKGLYLFRHFFSTHAFCHKNDIKSSQNNLLGTLVKLTNDFFEYNLNKFNSLSDGDAFFEHLEKKQKEEFLSFLNYCIYSYADLNNSKIEKYEITPDDDEFKYFYIKSFYPTFSWYWFPYKQNRRNSTMNIISPDSFEYYYSLLLEMSVNNSNKKVNNFKVEKKDCENIIFESPTIEKNSLFVINNQFLHGLGAPRYNCEKVLVSSNEIINNEPFDFL